MPEPDSWFGLYGESWKGAIVDEAFSHPAKFSRALIRAIYDHAAAMGWLKPGDWVVDPFGGVALGALDAMRLGLRWVGVELEEKFVSLGRQNIALWDDQFQGIIPIWGTARLLQGDSRRLCEVICEAVGCVSSPPYADGCRHTGGEDPGPEHMQGGTYHGLGYQATISSPPFEGSVGSDDPDKRGGLYRDPKRRGDVSLTGTYGDTPGQLGAMRGGFEAAISSPPYEGSIESRGDGIDWEKACERGTRTDGRGAIADGYGGSPGQLGSLKGGFEATVSSPPYYPKEDRKVAWGHSEDALDKDDEGRGHPMPRQWRGAYSTDPANLGNPQGADAAETFWQAARLIVEQVYQGLVPGGVAIWVCKDFVRDKQRVRFTHQWAQLCEAVGFEWLHEHRCWVVEDNGTQLALIGEDVDLVTERKSFFRRLAEKKGSPRIDWESVLCMRKPE